MMTTNLFVIANVKQLRTGGSFRILLSFFRTSWCVGVLNSAIFKFSKSGWVWQDFGGPSEFRGVGVEPPPKPPPRYATVQQALLFTVSTIANILSVLTAQKSHGMSLLRHSSFLEKIQRSCYSTFCVGGEMGDHLDTWRCATVVRNVRNIHPPKDTASHTVTP